MPFRFRAPSPLAFTTIFLRNLAFGGWCVSCAYLFRRYMYDMSPSEGPSMYPTLPTHTRTTIISKSHRLGRNLRVGDLVHFRSPMLPETFAVKRVLGMPGDFVVRDPSLAGAVGGWDGTTTTAPMQQQDNDDQQKGEDEAVDRQEQPVMIEVPPGHIWVAGDNMDWSRDSRFYGALPMGLVLGKVIAYSRLRGDWLTDLVWPGDGLERVGPEPEKVVEGKFGMPPPFVGSRGEEGGEEWERLRRERLRIKARREARRLSGSTGG